MAKNKAKAARRQETIGCDVGDRKSEIYILLSKGKSERSVVSTRRVAWEAFLKRPAAHVVLEAGTHSGWISRLAQEAGHRVTVANPRRLKLISQSDSKRDRSDAELLARLGSADPKLLAPIEHRGPKEHADLAVPRARDLLVTVRTRLVNHVRGAVKSAGERLPKCSARSFDRRAATGIPTELRPALDPMLKLLTAVDLQIRALDREIALVAKRYPDVEVIRQIGGVGPITALVFVLTLAKKERFRKSRTVGAYLGMRPKQDQSGDIDKQLGITKAGNVLLRRLLVNCANYILGPFGPDSDLKTWGLKLSARGGKNARRRAKVAVARKLAVLMHRLWVTGEVYQPIGYRPAA